MRENHFMKNPTFAVILALVALCFFPTAKAFESISSTVVASEGGQIAHLAKHGDIVYVLSSNSNRDLRLHRSTNGGANFTSNSPFQTSVYNGTETALCVDESGLVHIFWESADDSVLYWAYSDDDGDSFYEPIPLSSGMQWADSPACAIHPDGTLYLVFRAFNSNSIELYLVTVPSRTISENSTGVGGSAGWSPLPIPIIGESRIRYASSAGETPQQLTNNTIQEDNPAIAVSGNNVYISYIDRYNLGNAYVIVSEDGGDSFGEPRMVNFANGSAANEYHLAMGTPSANGLIIAYGDSNADLEGDLYAALTTVNTDSFIWTEIADSRSRYQMHPELAVQGDTIYVTWYDFRNNNAEVYLDKSADGLTFGEDFNVTNAAGEQFVRDIAADEDGIFILATDYTTEPYSTRLYTVRDEDAPKPRKAIIVTTAPNPGDPLTTSINTNSEYAYQTLRLQGYGDDQILFLSNDSTTDLDGDGEMDIDGLLTRQNLEQGILEWAADASDLTVYLVGHGGRETFTLNSREILNASDLDTWLDDYQTSTGGEVVVVYDACYSGSFLPILTPPTGKPRIVITSTRSDELAFMESDGLVSFSYYFWSQIAYGSSTKDAFNKAVISLDVHGIRQVPQVDADGDGVSDKGEATLLADLYIGDGIVHAAARPVINNSMKRVVLTQENSTKLWVDGVTAAGEITRVWAIITPPDYHPEDPTVPIMDLPTVELRSLGSGYYEGTYDGFEQQGVYHVAFYAQDIDGAVSMPRRGKVIKSGSQGCRRAIYCR